jgi:hypothetical protein
MLGARKWKGPRAGLTLQRFLKKAKYLSLFLLKNNKEMSYYRLPKFVFRNIPEEIAGNVDSFAAHDDDFLAFQSMLSDDCCYPTKEMAIAIDYYGLKARNEDDMKYFSCKCDSQTKLTSENPVMTNYQFQLILI